MPGRGQLNSRGLVLEFYAAGQQGLEKSARGIPLRIPIQRDNQMIDYLSVLRLQRVRAVEQGQSAASILLLNF